MDSQTEINYDYRWMSNPQYWVSFSFGLISSAASLAGSLTVITLVIKHRRWTSLYQRIMVGLSCMDVIMTSGIMIGPFAVLRETTLLSARGNTFTCDLSGFMILFWAASYTYNGILSFYFLLTIRYGVRETKASKYLEPWIHLFPIVVALTFGILSWAGKEFNPDTMYGICDHSQFPPGCSKTDSCTRGVSKTQYRLALQFTVLSFVLLGIVCTWMVYWTVRQRTRRNLRHSSTSGLTNLQTKRIQMVGMQAVWYTLAFLNGFLVLLIPSILSFSTKTKQANTGWFTALLSIVYLLFPLEGFLNFLVYVRPDVARWRELNPTSSWPWAFRKALSGASPSPQPARLLHIHESDTHSVTEGQIDPPLGSGERGGNDDSPRLECEES